jgi:hypothetical protein
MAAAMKAVGASSTAAARPMAAPFGSAAARRVQLQRPCRVVLARAVDGACCRLPYGSPAPVHLLYHAAVNAIGRAAALAVPCCANPSSSRRASRACTRFARPLHACQPSTQHPPPPKTHANGSSPPSPPPPTEDAELEARLAKLKAAKGETTDAEKRQARAARGPVTIGGPKRERPCETPWLFRGMKNSATSGLMAGSCLAAVCRCSLASASPPQTDPPNRPPSNQLFSTPPAPAKKAGKVDYDYTNETLYWEGGPAGGDLVFNIALGATVLWLPLTFAAVGRSIFLKYKFTDRRLSVSDTFPGYGGFLGQLLGGWSGLGLAGRAVCWEAAVEAFAEANKPTLIATHQTPTHPHTPTPPSPPKNHPQAARPTWRTRRWPRCGRRRAALARGATWWWCCATETRWVCEWRRRAVAVWVFACGPVWVGAAACGSRR